MLRQAGIVRLAQVTSAWEGAREGENFARNL
jgi:hypothetical protein